MSRRVTDLDKFALEDIWRPFQGSHPAADFEPRLTSSPMSLEATADELSKDTKWSRNVLGRLKGIGIYFPRYIQHPLVDVVRAALRPTPSSPEPREKP